jgi:uncharacterized coiled-coil protein SlyX|tara:strand:+ start:460 stop:642 length:183 start_codon:yes stop_codon:yes gene_type:complete
MNELDKLKNHIKAQDEIIADLSDDVIQLSMQSDQKMLKIRELRNDAAKKNQTTDRNRYEF